jgi:hypothetical protein
MKVRITQTITVTEEERLAINHFLNEEGKASHGWVVNYIEQHGTDFSIILKTYYEDKAEEFQAMADRYKDTGKS